MEKGKFGKFIDWLRIPSRDHRGEQVKIYDAKEARPKRETGAEEIEVTVVFTDIAKTALENLMFQTGISPEELLSHAVMDEASLRSFQGQGAEIIVVNKDSTQFGFPFSPIKGFDAEAGVIPPKNNVIHIESRRKKS